VTVWADPLVRLVVVWPKVTLAAAGAAADGAGVQFTAVGRFSHHSQGWWRIAPMGRSGTAASNGRAGVADAGKAPGEIVAIYDHRRRRWRGLVFSRVRGS